jgi:molybdate transport system substrate-binding protein
MFSCVLFVLIVSVFILPGGQTAVSAGGRQDVPALSEPVHAPVTIMAAAAASLEYSYREIIALFQAKYPWITVEGTYASSGQLQTQIEQGLEADVFMSAAARQMDNLVNQNLIAAESVKALLENKIVLIKPVGISTAVTGFQTAALAQTIALGDPASVPAGQYAREVFTSLGVWEEVSAKASFGSNVTEVLNWVGEGSADAGVVYATDAAATKKVEVIAEAPAGSLSTKVVYPVGIATASAHPAEARLFADFLGSEEGLAVFSGYGFSPSR